MSNFEPLAVFIDPPPSNVLQIYPGQTGELNVVVSNQLPEDKENEKKSGMVVEVYLDLSNRLVSWCKSSRTSFAIDGGRSETINFQWEIPVDAIENIYRYDLVVDSPSLRAPLQYSLELEVLTPIQASVSINDPTFTIQPLTSSRNPIELKTIPLIIQVSVHNRSNIVDQFRLTCPDLDDNWFTVRYPEGIQQQGLISGGNQLSLNPNDKGEITLLLHPPANTLSGNYRPTIRLISTVKPDLLLQDIFYFYVPPEYQFNLELKTIRDRVRDFAALYQIVFRNEGNTIRRVELSYNEDGSEEKICQHQLDQSQLKIAPGKTIAIQLKVKPTKRFGRPFFGAPKQINFQVDVEDLDKLALPNYLPLRGLLLWEARPWWQLLLLVLSGVITVGGLAFVVWWLIFRQSPAPELVSVEPTEKSYQFGEEIKLNWEIAHPERLKQIKLLAKNAQGEQAIDPQTFDTEELKKDSKCQFLSQNNQNSLICRGISTGAREPKDYIFTLSLMTQEMGRVKEVGKQDTILVKITPPPTPMVSNVGSLKTIYTLEDKKPARVDLKFQVSHPEEVQSIDVLKNGVILSTLTPTDTNFPKLCQVDKENNLNCYIQIPVAEVGENYIFSVKAIPKNSQYVTPQQPVDSKTPVSVVAKQIPLVIKLFTINEQDFSPVKIKFDENTTVKWNVTGKAPVKVNITGVTQDLEPQGNYIITPDKLPTNLGDQPYEIILTAIDADGNTQKKGLFVQIEQPNIPSPSPSIITSPNTPSPSPSLVLTPTPKPKKSPK